MQLGSRAGATSPPRTDRAPRRWSIINEAFRRRVWPGQDPLGKLIRVSDGGPNPRQVVGVVERCPPAGLDHPAPARGLPAVFPEPDTPRYLTLVVRTAAEPGAALTAAIKREVWALDPNLPVSQVATMDDVVAGAVGQPRFNLLLLNLFAATALILAALGIYGVMAYSVSRRTQEIGIRMALGAQPATVRRLVVRQGMALAAAGLALGLGAALLATPAMDGLLFGVSATDPATFVDPAGAAGGGGPAGLLPARPPGHPHQPDGRAARGLDESGRPACVVRNIRSSTGGQVTSQSACPTVARLPCLASIRSDRKQPSLPWYPVLVDRVTDAELVLPGQRLAARGVGQPADRALAAP